MYCKEVNVWYCVIWKFWRINEVDCFVNFVLKFDNVCVIEWGIRFIDL